MRGLPYSATPEQVVCTQSALYCSPALSIQLKALQAGGLGAPPDLAGRQLPPLLPQSLPISPLKGPLLSLPQ